MIILTIRTDKPEAELGIYDSNKQVAYLTWQAHRELANTIHAEVEKILNKSSISLEDIEGIVCFKGPGSFTGLRIGLSVANALAYSLQVPVIAAGGENWIKQGINDIQAGKDNRIATPEYSSPAATSSPTK